MNINDSRILGSNSYDPDDGTNPGDGIVQWKWNIFDYDEHYLPTGVGETFYYSLLPRIGADWEPDILTLYIKDASENYVYTRSFFGVNSNVLLEGSIIWDGIGSYGSYDDLPLPPGNYTVNICARKSGIFAYETNPLTIFDVRIASPCGDPTSSTDANDNNEKVFNSASPGVLTVQCTAVPTPDIDMSIWALLNDTTLRWTITTITGSTLTWDSSWPGASTKGEGTSCTATFTGLPPSNDSFGIKEVKLEFLPDGVNVASTKTTNIEVFYTKTATNHPSGESNSNWPNWMYYWMQTVTPLGNPTPTFSYGTFNAYLWEWNEISLSDNCAMYYDAPYGTHNTLTGIDLFAWRVRHESQHYVDATAFWDHDLEDYLTYHLGFFGAGDDYDGDYLPNQFEDENLNQAFNVGEFYDWADDNTYETPDVADDNEDWDCRRNKDIVGVHGADWGNPGMKHKTNDIYDD